MKRAKRMLALVLAVMLLGTFYGRVSGNVSGESTGKEDTAGTDEKKTEESVQSGGTESFKLTVHSSAYQGDWNDYWIIKEIEKRFDVDIQVEMISNDVWNDKRRLCSRPMNCRIFFSIHSHRPILSPMVRKGICWILRIT